ncbi:hypothetical protein BH24CHL5_BH24CHL5_10430 [soil metagenome]
MSHAPAGDGVALRIGTRGSALALAQAELVADALAERGIAHETVIIETAGDRRAADTAWGEGAFVTAIENALLDGRADIAVHSAKDVPTDEDPRLRVAAYLSREEPRDALVLPAGRQGSLDDLPPGTIVGTDSPRRTGFLRAHRSDLDVRPLHGNVDTRLRRLDEGQADALVLAAAGLKRLGRAERISQLLPFEIIPPAPGQGAIAVQVRASDTSTRELVERINDQSTQRAVEAEREFLLATGGGCRAPIGALATIDSGRLELVGAFATLDGRAAGMERLSGDAADGQALGRELAERIRLRRSSLPGAPRVLLTRAEHDSRRVAARLAEYGIASAIVPAIEVELLDAGAELSHALATLADYDWVIATSANGARAAGSAARRMGIDLAAARWAAVGRATARELIAAGAADAWLPTQASAAGIGAELPLERGARVLWLHGQLADETLPAALIERGAQVTAVVAYRTVEAPGTSAALLAAELERGIPDAVVLASPSAVRGLLALGRQSARADVASVPAICVGPRTAQAAREAGLTVAAVAAAPDSSIVAELTAQLLLERSAQTESVPVPE